MNIGETIRQKRKEYNYTQQNLADKLMISRTTISSWETGRTYPDISMLITLSELFETSVDYLLKGDIEMVTTLDKDLKKGKKLKYYVGILLVILVIVGTYFLMVNIKKDELYENVSDWKKVGGLYSHTEGDMTYMVGNFDSLDIRNIPKQLGLSVDRYNDENSQITMEYNGNNNDIQVSFLSGPIEGMTIVFDESFAMDDEASDSNKVKYSYEIRKSVNDLLNKEREYLKNTFVKVRSKWEEINNKKR